MKKKNIKVNEKKLAIKMILCLVYLIVITILFICAYRIFEKEQEIPSWTNVESVDDYTYMTIYKMSEKFAYYKDADIGIHFIIEKEETGQWHTYIIAIKESDYNKYKPIIDYTYERTDVEPEPMRVYGYPVNTSEELKELAIKNIENFVPATNEVKINKDNYEAYLTNSYLDTTQKRKDDFNVVLFATLFLLFIVIMLFIFTIFDNGKKQDNILKIKKETKKMKGKTALLFILTLIALSFTINVNAETIIEKDNKKYCIDDNENIVTGFVEIDGSTYFFSRAKEIYGQMKYGWQDDGTHKFYLDGKTGVLQKNGLFEYNKKKYYANEEGYIQGGPIEIDGNIYFFSRAKEIYGQMKYGWQDDGTHKFYLDEKTRKLQKNGLFEYNKKKYYANEEGYIQGGPIEIDGNIYFFSRAKEIYGQMKYGWQDDGTNKFYLDEKTGVLQKGGLFEYKNKKYYANEEGYIQGGPIEIDGNIYFFSRAKEIYGQMKYGWQDDGVHKFYLDDQTGILQKDGFFEYNEKKYYANAEGYIQSGFIRIDGKLYFFSRENRKYGQLKYGWQKGSEGIWYQDEEGIVNEEEGLVVIKDKEYYFKGRYAQIGIVEIDGKRYYFNTSKYNKEYGEHTTKYVKYYLDGTTGEIKRIQRIPIYYNQKDDRWRYIKIGNATFGSSGCVPTSLAMAFSSIKEREILPIEIGYYLYENTDQFNRRYVGASGMAIIYASNKYGVNYKNIYTKESLKNELDKGNIVYGTMQNGKFARPNWNHAIIIYDYDESNGKVKTIASDPLDIYNNGWVDVDLIWNEKNTDPDDLTGGSALYSLT